MTDKDHVHDASYLDDMLPIYAICANGLRAFSYPVVGAAELPAADHAIRSS